MLQSQDDEATTVRLLPQVFFGVDLIRGTLGCFRREHRESLPKKNADYDRSGDCSGRLLYFRKPADRHPKQGNHGPILRDNFCDFPHAGTKLAPVCSQYS